MNLTPKLRFRLVPRSQRKPLLTCRFPEAGSHHIRLEINSPDLDFDNEYRIAVNVLERIGVLLKSMEILATNGSKEKTDFPQNCVNASHVPKPSLKT